MNERKGAPPPASSSKPQLSEDQCARVERARRLADMPAGDIPALMGEPEDLGLAYGLAFSEARFHVLELLAVIVELTGERDYTAATVAAFDRIAAVLADFDWEHDDRQYALEAIERIVLTGGSGQ